MIQTDSVTRRMLTRRARPLGVLTILLLTLTVPAAASAQAPPKDPDYDYAIAPGWEGDWRLRGSASIHTTPASGTLRITQSGPRTFQTAALSDIYEATTGCRTGTAGTAFTGPLAWPPTFGVSDGPNGSAAVGDYEYVAGGPPRCTGIHSTQVVFLGSSGANEMSMWDKQTVRPVFSRIERISHPVVPYVALGDSYSSGEGAGNYDKPRDRQEALCHRSAGAWPRLLAALSARRSLLDGPQLKLEKLAACSGAESPALLEGGYRHQIAQKDELALAGARFVTLTIGGNDVGFGPTLRKCFLGRQCLSERNDAPKGRPASSEFSRARARVQALAERLPKIYEAIAGELVDPQRLVVVGYPDLFPEQNETCRWLTADELRRLNVLEQDLEQALQHATAEADVRFVSVFLTTSGQQMCTRGSGFVDISGRRITSRLLGMLVGQHKLQELGHPRTVVQRRIAQTVAYALRIVT